MEPRLTLFGRQSRGARRCPAIPPLDDHLIADLRTQSAHLVFIGDRSWSAVRNSSRCRTFRSRARRLRRYNGALRLHCGDGNGVDDVGHQGAAGQIVDGPV